MQFSFFDTRMDLLFIITFLHYKFIFRVFSQILINSVLFTFEIFFSLYFEVPHALKTDIKTRMNVIIIDRI